MILHGEIVASHGIENHQQKYHQAKNYIQGHTVDGSEIRLTTWNVYNLVNNGEKTTNLNWLQDFIHQQY